MFNADDAVARVDSYVVSVAGAASLVGERKLVDRQRRSLGGAGIAHKRRRAGSVRRRRGIGGDEANRRPDGAAAAEAAGAVPRAGSGAAKKES